MPLTALDVANVKRVATDLPTDFNIRQAWTCPYCLGKMSFVDAIERIKHFRHYVASDGCSTEPDTIAHMELKKTVFDLATAKGFECKYEVRIGNHIADIVSILPNGTKYAIECQISPITRVEFETRTANYKRHGYKCVWYLYPTNYLKYIRSITSRRDVTYAIFRLKSIERALYQSNLLRYVVGSQVFQPDFFQSRYHKTYFLLNIDRYPELMEELEFNGYLDEI